MGKIAIPRQQKRKSTYIDNRNVANLIGGFSVSEKVLRCLYWSRDFLLYVNSRGGSLDLLDRVGIRGGYLYFLLYIIGNVMRS